MSGETIERGCVDDLSSRRYLVEDHPRRRTKGTRLCDRNELRRHRWQNFNPAGGTEKRVCGHNRKNRLTENRKMEDRRTVVRLGRWKIALRARKMKER